MRAGLVVFLVAVFVTDLDDLAVFAVVGFFVVVDDFDTLGAVLRDVFLVDGWVVGFEEVCVRDGIADGAQVGVSATSVALLGNGLRGAPGRSLRR